MFLIRNLNYSAYVYVANRERASIKIPFDAPQVDKLPQEGLMSQALVEVEWSPGTSEPLPTLTCRREFCMEDYPKIARTLSW